MADESYENVLSQIHEGFENDLEKTNKLAMGSDEKLKAMKTMETRYKMELQEYELTAKLTDMAKRRELEEERLRIEKEKAIQEMADRRAAEKAEARRARIQAALSGGAILTSIAFAVIGYLTDRPESEMIRNHDRDKDRDRLFNLGDKLRK